MSSELPTRAEAPNRGHPYRVFVSYSHDDATIAKDLVSVLREVGLSPIWDDDLEGGAGFTDQIKSFIANAHVFLPLLTEKSHERPWLHQELGFALGAGKPVVPVSEGFVLPPGIISGLQPVRLHDDRSEWPAQLSHDLFARRMASVQDRPVIYECTPENITRARLLAQYAEEVTAIRGRGRVRQRASLTSFHLPDRGPGDPIWRKYYPQKPGDHLLFSALRRERIALQKHALDDGCTLVLDPVHKLGAVYDRYGPHNVEARVRGLLGFLRDASVQDVVVAINDDDERRTSITLVGDWFSSEAVSSAGRSVLRESVFTRSFAHVSQALEDFDDRVRDLLAQSRWTESSSREEAIRLLESFVAGS